MSAASRNSTRNLVSSKRKKKAAVKRVTKITEIQEKTIFRSYSSLQDVEDYDHPVPIEAEQLYAKVAKETFLSGYNTTVRGKLPSRSPYLEGAKMGRGSDFSERYRHYQETGGVARWKNTVVMNIRLNDLRDIQSANGNGTFKCSFFMDVAFWVPWWDAEHFDTQATVGTFSRFEPLFEFPGVDVEGGMLRWGLRSAEFSKNSDSRHHEGQLGQNYESAAAAKGGAAGGKKMVSVIDPGSHWPRLWRVSITDDELEAMSKLDRKEKKSMEPSNENPMPKGLQPRLRKLFEEMDHERERNLSKPTEGVAFVTYEIDCTHRNEFQLNEFPFDMHNLNIVVRLGAKDGDPMSRVVVPPSHDKAFFVSGRVPKIVDYHLARNLDWNVTKEPASLGGCQRLNSAVIVCRKPGYYVRNHIIVVFLLSSSSFTSFLAMPDDLNSRVAILFTVLLSIVAFKYSGSEVIPQVSYSTTLDAYILLNFYVLLLVGMLNCGFSTQCTMGGNLKEGHVMKDLRCSLNPGRWYAMDFLPAYSPLAETIVGVLLFITWLVGNWTHWYGIWKRVQFNLGVVDKAMIGWMTYKYKGPKGTKGLFMSEKFITFKKPSKELGCFGLGSIWPKRCCTSDKSAPPKQLTVKNPSQV